MQLLKCKIENFGKLSNVSLDFNDGLNSFVADNGWGKSTLAAFIKVMFFGFDGERSRDEIANERKRYNPWQGGPYGGSLTFVANGKKYVMTRIFGVKEKDDIFELRDADTNLVSSDFLENVGEALFQIDRDSFARTIFITQNDCKTETTDRINAKLGNLAEHTDDINNFETVREYFKEMLNKMSPTRKTGSIAQRKSQIVEIEQELRLGVAIDQTIERLTASKEEKKAEYATLKNRKRELEEKQQAVQLQKDLQVKREKYQMLCDNLEMRRIELAHVQAHFPGAMPQETDLVTYGQMSQALLQSKHSIEHYSLSPEEEKILTMPVPEESEIDECWDIYPQIQELDKRILAESTALQTARATARSGKSKKWSWFLIGGVLVFAGGGSIVMDAMMSGIALLIVSLVCLIWGLAGGKKKEEKLPFIEREQNLKHLQEQRDNLYQNMIHILAQYIKEEEISESRLLLTLQELRSCAQNAKVLREKKEKHTKATWDYNERQQKIRSYLESLSIQPESDLVGQFANLREHLKNYDRMQQFYEDAKLTKDRFEASIDLREFAESASMNVEESLTDIGEELRYISNQLEELHQDILSYNGQLELQREKKDRISEKEEELELLRELQMKEQKKRNLIEKTKELLEQAKISFTKKYMAPIMNGFEKYYEILTGTPAEKHQLDANTKMTIEEGGTQHDTRFFSAGYQDLIGVCMRLALVDAMYRDEKPFIIMDDPFINLDEEKTQGGLTLLDEVAKEYQVVYFSCHRSRMKDEK